MSSGIEGERSGGRVVGGLRHLLGWTPVWVPLLLLWQVGTRGLAPALAEQRRLQDEEVVVRARNERTKAEFEHLEREARAWRDPVYRERMRRAIAAEEQATRQSTEQR
jgi:hypothetical protein